WWPSHPAQADRLPCAPAEPFLGGPRGVHAVPLSRLPHRGQRGPTPAVDPAVRRCRGRGLDAAHRAPVLHPLCSRPAVQRLSPGRCAPGVRPQSHADPREPGGRLPLDSTGVDQGKESIRSDAEGPGPHRGPAPLPDGGGPHPGMWVLGTVYEFSQGRVWHAGLALANAAFLAYAVVRFIGLRECWTDFAMAVQDRVPGLLSGRARSTGSLEAEQTLG